MVNKTNNMTAGIGFRIDQEETLIMARSRRERGPRD